MELIDVVAVAVAIAACTASTGWTLSYWRRCVETREYEELVGDIRAMNQYSSYFLSAIIVLFGVTFEKGAQVLPDTALVLFLATLISAAASIFFIPIEKGQTVRARHLWLAKLIPSQWAVILAVIGTCDAAAHVLR